MSSTCTLCEFVSETIFDGAYIILYKLYKRCNPRSVTEKGGAYCQVNIMEEIDFTSGSQTTEEERTGFTIDKCILKVCIVFFRISLNFFDTFQGLPDCVCMLHSEEKTMVIFCAEVSYHHCYTM